MHTVFSTNSRAGSLSEILRMENKGSRDFSQDHCCSLSLWENTSALLASLRCRRTETIGAEALQCHCGALALQCLHHGSAAQPGNRGKRPRSGLAGQPHVPPVSSGRVVAFREDRSQNALSALTSASPTPSGFTVPFLEVERSLPLRLLLPGLSRRVGKGKSLDGQNQNLLRQLRDRGGPVAFHHSNHVFVCFKICRIPGNFTATQTSDPRIAFHASSHLILARSCRVGVLCIIIIVFRIVSPHLQIRKQAMHYCSFCTVMGLRIRASRN